MFRQLRVSSVKWNGTFNRSAVILLQLRFQSQVAATPILEYDRLVKLGKLRDDPHQRKIIKSLAHLHENLMNYYPAPVKRPSPLDQVGWRASVIGRLFKRRKSSSNEAVAKGIYLYGDVGCGKTMLMDLFYATIPAHLSKSRIHFHQFMQHVHKRSHDIIKEQNLDALGEAKGKEIDPIPLLAAEIANKSRVLCFDEFQVTDVADAMILRRLLTTLLSNEYGVVLFTTSNRNPDELYVNGVQRQSFIPCIQLLKTHTEVIFLDSPTDYRKVSRPVSDVYYYPKKGLLYRSKKCELARAKHVDGWFNYFAQIQEENQNSSTSLKTTRKVLHQFPLKIWGRELLVPRCIKGHVAQFSFKELCGQPLAAGDYLSLAATFKAFVVTDIPYLSIFVRDEVRRFITFLDAVYDSGGKLATTGAADFTSLFVEPEHILNDYQLKEASQETPKKQQEVGLDDDLVSKHGFSKEIAKKAQMFALDEERFAFARALSRLSQMSTTTWVEKK
ncbi:Afg1p Ecym_5470 [Eremothecium cymbalariae DBVPG|uniref:AAA+ ATPase domain-containing protein n=1 Tax=Eremothecium cymbalariae (strain CBS 270.75 / DBVPG 7215 / KCTC 17166 / NRRL Y-17582) TaxID=931890 RepID=I6NDS5_ERECY|nr:hypothetical protein Ecym_5470 [Eremothecium cymbalariae DBVPG\